MIKIFKYKEENYLKNLKLSFLTNPGNQEHSADGAPRATVEATSETVNKSCT